jgi:3-hydroxyisobutyrate dehydrogenase-like beta-hydroxyacid dehydrogenase
MKKPAIGFIGLGVMGNPMARNLAKAGYPLTVHDKNAAAADRIVREFKQVQTVESPKLVAEFSE